MKIFRNTLIVVVTILLYVQVSLSSDKSTTCIKKESYNKGYVDAVHDISKGNWRYTELGLSMRFESRIDYIKKEAAKYGLKVRMQDEFSDENEFCYKKGYNKAVREKLKEKYGFDVIQKILEK